MTDTVHVLDLPAAAAERLAHQLDRLLANSRNSVLHVRAAVREIAATFVVRGDPGEVVVDRLERTVLEHARERGLTERSIVTAQPAAAVARRVARWAAEVCAPDHPCLRRRPRPRSHRADSDPPDPHDGA